MPEIKLTDLQEMKPQRTENFQSIKPEQGTSLERAKNYWNDVFNDENGVRYTDLPETKNERAYYDDNGTLYRKGNRLEPNSKFEVRGYSYETDKNGRTVSAEGKLRLRDSSINPEIERNKMDKMASVGKGDQIEGDQRGHLIGLQFDGSGGIENLSPMSGELNQKDYAKLENKLADAVKDGADVYLKVEPKYEGESSRPSEYRVSYSIDGDRDVVVFRNGREDNT